MEHPESTAQAVWASVKEPRSPANEKLDIEHAEVADDPRQWSSARKVNIPPFPHIHINPILTI